VVIGMRRAAVGSIVVLVLLAVLVVAMQRSEDSKVRAAVACQNELVLIDYWKSLDLIREVRHEGNDLIVEVDYRSWTRLPRPLQLQIGKAAYCPIGQAGKGGAARIDSGGELARVENGKWSSRQFPE
jgi:hypothetical protein